MRRRSRGARARRLRLALWAGVCALLCGGCRPQREARWLELEQVTPSLLEPGSTLRIEGNGFAPGQSGVVRLRGRGYRPGLPEIAVDVELQGRAVSASEVTVPLDADSLARLGGHGSFDGELTLAFAVRDGEGRLTGSKPVRFDLSLPLARGVAHEQRLRERARALLEFAGVVPAEEESLQSGLVVRYARAGSRAAALGLRHGDVIARAGEVNVHALSDLAPPPGARALALLIGRPGERAELRLRLPLDGLHAPDLSAELGRLSGLLAFVFSSVLLLAPWSAARWLARCAARLRRAPAPQLGLWGGALQPRAAGGLRRRLARRLGAAIWPLALSVAGVLLVWLEPAGFLAVRSVSLYLGLCAVSVTLTLMSDAGTRRERLRAAAGVAGRMLVMGVLIACACALSGTRAFDGMVVGQGAWPFRWALLQKPALLVAFPLYVVFASRLGAATLALEMRGHTAHLLVAERVLTNVVLCALGVAIFAGGWQSPEELFIDGLDPRLLGALLYVLKAWGFALLLSAARRMGLGEGLPLRAIALLCVASVALTALWLWLEPSAGFELALGRAACMTLTVIAIAAMLQAWRRTEPGWA